uniref:Acetylglutamate kinase n=1 Tax=Liagoropsis maxima TaxID=1653392 RepID=A0A1G4NW60_9FLOR|nr:Acetylglutamate kinase [Liagoropsis maxima]SCW22854.1 Acetylglutamate kinase [Liagoropsis maxima]
MNYSDKIASFEQIIPRIESIKGKIIVIKYGGSAMKDERLTQQVIHNIVLLSKLGINFVVVHGGGPIINKWLEKLNIKPKFENGIRITDEVTMDVVEMVLAGKVNKSLVALLNSNNLKALGLCGKDSNCITAAPIHQSLDNRVANVQSVNPELIYLLIKNNYIPVIAPVAADALGVSYNINADTVAGEIAASLNAHSLLMLTDTPGILYDHTNPSTLAHFLNLDDLDHLIDIGTIQGGMLPKVYSCIKALSAGVNSARIIDGRIPGSILLSLLTDSKVGSVISR